ncbi:MAG: EVE domain-containing protein, partial [Planctomycetales bacterium]|nr:EVE domain-containing protein [Planctomycetales bacterium]
RTEELLSWLEARALIGRGHIAAYANSDAAAAVGMPGMTRHGRVFGNILSRLDFACYRLDLPPLGLTAEAPFDQAWQQKDRSWPFPIAAMQKAAQRFRWLPEHFEQLRSETSKLPGQAHLIWKNEFAENESNIRSWVEGLEREPGPHVPQTDPEPETPSSGRNPNWTRDEHILGLDLYLRLRGTSYPKEHPEVIQLSRVLKRLAALRGTKGTATFRNANGVSMKMLNFRRVDPEYHGTGLPQGNGLEVAVWNEFANEPERLNAAVEHILKDIESENPKSTDVEQANGQHWVFVCNPAKWSIDKFLASGIRADTWGVRPSDAEKFAAGQLALVRVGDDRRSKEKLEGRPRLEAGIYAVCEIEGGSFHGTGANDAYWAEGAAREPGWPTVRVRYLRSYMESPLTIKRLRQLRPHLSHLLLDGFQGASFPISNEDFAEVLELLGEDSDSISGLATPEDASTSNRLAELERRYFYASPEVKTRVSRSIERGPISREVKKANEYRCQICQALGMESLGFRKRNGEPYVEAHHVMPVHLGEIGSLSAANIVTLCANHHREVHYGEVDVGIDEQQFTFRMANKQFSIPRPKVRQRIGILAYGSLITHPGAELEAITVSTKKGIETPFAVEYARSSNGRAGAPTLVPVASGGSKVQAWIYEVDADEKLACDVLYRRETNRVGSAHEYEPPVGNGSNKVKIDRIEGLAGFDVVLSTSLPATIDPLTAAKLADLAISSARKLSNGRDGISYLLHARKSGISTPLTEQYTQEILGRLNVNDLSDAVIAARARLPD